MPVHCTGMRYLGIDYGTKNVGIALSDDTATLAFPKAVLPNTGTLANEIQELCTSEHVDTIVLGESKDFQGNANPVMKDIDVFKNEIEKLCGIPVKLEPEFLTSSEAARQSKEESMHDARAAALILQRYLDRKKNEDK